VATFSYAKLSGALSIELPSQDASPRASAGLLSVSHQLRLLPRTMYRPLRRWPESGFKGPLGGVILGVKLSPLFRGNSVR
jgi:hypothetical protein